MYNEMRLNRPLRQLYTPKITLQNMSKRNQRNIGAKSWIHVAVSRGSQFKNTYTFITRRVHPLGEKEMKPMLCAPQLIWRQCHVTNCHVNKRRTTTTTTTTAISMTVTCVCLRGAETCNLIGWNRSFGDQSVIGKGGLWNLLNLMNFSAEFVEQIPANGAKRSTFSRLKKQQGK